MPLIGIAIGFCPFELFASAPCREAADDVVVKAYQVVRPLHSPRAYVPELQGIIRLRDQSPRADRRVYRKGLQPETTALSTALPASGRVRDRTEDKEDGGGCAVTGCMSLSGIGDLSTRWQKNRPGTGLVPQPAISNPAPLTLCASFGTHVDSGLVENRDLHFGKRGGISKHLELRDRVLREPEP